MGIGFAKTKMNLPPDTYCLDVCVFLFLSFSYTHIRREKEGERCEREGAKRERVEGVIEHSYFYF